MRRFALLSLLVLPFGLTGCGGSGEGCSAQFRYVPKASYAGRYDATFTPAGSTAATVTFSLTVSDLAVVTGSATRLGSASTLTGTAGDIVNGCSDDTTGFVLFYDTVEAQGQRLTGVKRRNGSILGQYAASVTSAGIGTQAGTVVVSTPAAQ